MRGVARFQMKKPNGPLKRSKGAGSPRATDLLGTGDQSVGAEGAQVPPPTRQWQLLP